MSASDFEFAACLGLGMPSPSAHARGWFTVLAIVAVVAGATLGFIT